MFKKRARIVVSGIFILLLVYLVNFCRQAFPITTGYGAKVLCSSIFVSGRGESAVISEDLNFPPLNFASFNVDYKDSSVTCSLLGLAERKAIYRRGLGATLVNGISEQTLRAQQFNLPAYKPVLTDTIAWPMGDKIVGSFPSELDSLKVASAMDLAFANNKDSTTTNITRALIVLYDGRIIAERYASGISRNTRLTGWSMTKSITGALTGLLVKQGRLDINALAPVPEWKDESDPRHGITIVNLLQQTSGLDFSEVYYRPADANRMLFREKDAAAYTATRKLVKKPGTKFRYSSGNTNILSRIFRQTLGDREYQALPYEQLFFKLGMYSAVLEPDPSGTYVGSSFCYATARDWARFGLLYYNKGTWNNEQILPAEWITKSITPTAAAEKGEYGFQWWLNAGEKNKPANRLYDQLPVDMYWADGFEGQNIFVIPSKKLVVVRLGLTRASQWGESRFIEAVIEGIRK